MSAPSPDRDWHPASGSGGTLTGHDRSTPRPRPGWHAYRIAGQAELPSWAVEVALTIERPPAPEADRLGFRTSAAARPAERDWAGEQVQAMVLLKAPGRTPWLAGAIEAIAEIERAAGVRPADRVDAVAGVRPVGRVEAVEGSGLVAGALMRMGRRSAGRIDAVAGVGPAGRTGVVGGVLPGTGARLRLGPGPGLPGLVPVAPAVALAGVAAAGARGLPAPLRRWRPAAGAMVWRPSAGAAVTCEGPSGVSAQAVVAVGGLGNVLAITPPPGGALVLRAWRARRTWAVACGLVIGRDSELGIGREAARLAAKARADGWHAAVLNGSNALQLARAGDPGAPAPEAAAHAATAAQVASMFEACLMAGVLDRPAAGSRWTLAVTP